MRNYPRQLLSRSDALAGPGHIGNHRPADFQTQQDRLLREQPGLSVSSVWAVYGGTGNPA
jgi:hypothetical protein